MSNGAQQAQLTVNQKVVNWTKGNLGTKIGRGECWDLGEQALKNAGAQTSNDLGPVGEDTDYIWGDSIPSVKDVRPGDILQIRDHVITTITVTKYVFTDGTSLEETREHTAQRGHHTAIVSSSPDSNGVISTYEQHVKPRGDVVQSLRLNTRSIDPVTTTSKGQYKNPTTKKLEQAKITKTVTVTVTGKIWPYRPKSKT
ncbi:hypothetical protein [Methylobacterium crusticola]|uniref:hypothetical protein n=1 Tax=Methylobacterium crusticola TaxID=1697972 RepID=UPI000FFBCE1B|nr:hypothetical protein [Methylobacterium crusticola]